MVNPFRFRGRLNRAAFWRLKIFAILLNAVGHAAVVPMMGHVPRGLPPGELLQAIGPAPIAILLVLLVVVTWILLAAGVRRWHDRDKSGWWMLLNVIPVVGTVWYMIECGFLPGTQGANRYGADPLEKTHFGQTAP
jgi:uncharacterized membrane protein YhaH (DUF805 family)